VYLEYFSRGGAGHLKRGLAGLQLDDPLVLGDRIPFLDEQLQDIARVDAVAEIGEFDFGGHGGGFGVQGSGFRVQMCCTMRSLVLAPN
jgi:hypothetical protein